MQEELYKQFQSLNSLSGELKVKRARLIVDGKLGKTKGLTEAIVALSNAMKEVQKARRALK